MEDVIRSRPRDLEGNREAIRRLRERAAGAPAGWTARLDALEGEAAAAHEAYAERQWRQFKDGVESSLLRNDPEAARAALRDVPAFLLERHREEIESLRRRAESPPDAEK
jgi:hypothetical protein